jgi:hypothetical protein
MLLADFAVLVSMTAVDTRLLCHDGVSLVRWEKDAVAICVGIWLRAAFRVRIMLGFTLRILGIHKLNSRRYPKVIAHSGAEFFWAFLIYPANILITTSGPTPETTRRVRTQTKSSENHADLVVFTA